MSSSETVLERFCISSEFGFLLENPDRELPSKYLQWQQLADEVSALVGTEELDEKIRSLPLLEIDELRSHRQLRLAHLVLCTLSSAYIWRVQDEPKVVLCRSIAKPFFDVSEKLGIHAIPTHSTVCLANWRKIDESAPWTPENLDIIGFRFLRDRDNAWFFVNTAEVERNLAPSICAIAHIVAKAENCERVSEEEYASCFHTIVECFRTATDTMKRMKDHLRPDVFYHGFRPYLNGYKDGPFRDQGGLIFEGLEHAGPQPIGGTSAAQSSTIQTIDAFLGVVHSDSDREFLDSQQEFMPVPHRAFIKWVQQNAPNVEGMPGRAEAAAELSAFRTYHIRIVTSYIINVKKQGGAATGTGGTNFMQFLKNVRNNCRD